MAGRLSDRTPQRDLPSVGETVGPRAFRSSGKVSKAALSCFAYSLVRISFMFPTLKEMIPSHSKVHQDVQRFVEHRNSHEADPPEFRTDCTLDSLQHLDLHLIVVVFSLLHANSSIVSPSAAYIAHLQLERADPSVRHSSEITVFQVRMTTLLLL